MERLGPQEGSLLVSDWWLGSDLLPWSGTMWAHHYQGYALGLGLSVSLFFSRVASGERHQTSVKILMSPRVLLCWHSPQRTRGWPQWDCELLRGSL